MIAACHGAWALDEGSSAERYAPNLREERHGPPLESSVQPALRHGLGAWALDCVRLLLRALGLACIANRVAAGRARRVALARGNHFRGLRGGLRLRRGKVETMPGSFFSVEDRVAVLAHGHTLFDFFAACRTLAGARWNVRPFAFHAHGDGGAAVHIGDFAERMAACPKRVALGNQAVIVSIPPSRRRGEFVESRARAGTDEDSVVVQVLKQILGDLACGNSEWEPAVIPKVESIAA